MSSNSNTTPFYQKALALFTRTQAAQIQKGRAKYPEPFNPHSWTPNELLNHALEETVDLTHYLVGLKELLDAKDNEIKELKKKINMFEEIYAITDPKTLRKPNINFEDSPFVQEERKGVIKLTAKAAALWEPNDSLVSEGWEKKTPSTLEARFKPPYVDLDDE